MDEKTCIKCAAVKQLNEFPAHPNMKTGCVNTCRDCKNAQQAARRQKLIQLSAAARRRLGIDPMPLKRVPQPNEAGRRENNLWSLPHYVPSRDNVVRQERAPVCRSTT